MDVDGRSDRDLALMSPWIRQHWHLNRACAHMRYVPKSHVLAHKTTGPKIGRVQTTKAHIDQHADEQKLIDILSVYDPESLIVIVVKIEFPTL